MKVTYFPGCTLKNDAQNFEDSALYSLEQLGIEVEELERWNCCGTVFSLATDDLIHHLAPIRNLIRARDADSDSVMTLCAMCFNTLKRANERVKGDPEALDRINAFMYREDTDYRGDVQVVHFLELLKERVTIDGIAEKVTRPLTGLKVASYYGCLLVRPADIGLDDVENPTILEKLTAALGAEPIDFPHKTECCAAYQTLDKPELVAERTYQIVNSAIARGAEVISVSCPLCAFNLDQRQQETVELYPDFKHIPILYFTQLLAIALGCREEALRFDLHYIDPEPVLSGRGLL